MTSPEQDRIKQQLLAHAAQFPFVAYLDSCGTEIDRYGDYEYLIAIADKEAEIVEQWQDLQDAPADWWFGVLTYDLKNVLEPELTSRNGAAIPFPELKFFRAQTVWLQRRGQLEPELVGKSGLWDGWDSREIPANAGVNIRSELRSNFSRSQYLDTIGRLRQHIRDGDCYEINLAQNFTLDAKVTHPSALWRRLTEVSPTPFAGYARFRDIHLLCASPERFLQLKGDRILTQPIKGTSARSRNRKKDRELAAQLRASEKEQAENVMIVDLSRHDLYKSAVVDGVKVPHLFEIQSFAKVHHLVSTIVAEKRPDLKGVDVLENTFPPGSMTGAPKFRTCELIDEYEPHARGIYSGSLGYFTPEGDFDLNVVIRSMVYDAAAELISYHVGGAITWDSDPESEYEETLVKARAIRQVLSENTEWN